METNIQKYMAFVETARAGSLTEAAKNLKYSQSGISRMISDLESEWGVTLIERQRYGIRITPEGETLLPYAKKLCSEFENIQHQVQELYGLDKGTIRIGTFSSVATHWLPKIIKKFQEDYPRIDYEILMGDYSEIEEWVDEGRVDCGFVSLPVHRDFEVIKLQKDQLMAIVPEDHKYARAETFPVSELDKEPFMLVEKGEKADISAFFKKNNISPNVRFTTWDDYAVMSMVENGLGISILNELILKRIPYRIVAKPLDRPAYRQIGFVIKSYKTAPLVVKKFMEYLDYRNT